MATNSHLDPIPRVCSAAPLRTAAVAEAALEEHPRNGDDPFAAPGVERAVQVLGKTWAPGRTLRIGFIGGSDVQRAKVKRWASEWLNHATLTFAWDAKDPEVRVAFDPRQGSWSLIGTDTLAAAASQTTVNFGWVTDTSADEDDRSVIVHEFGHTLGLGHEQSSPLSTIHWDKPAAYAYYARTQSPPWSQKMVDDNVFALYDPSEVSTTPYDPLSIMQYAVDPSLTLDGRGIGWNSDLSALDKVKIAAMYHAPAHPVVVVPPSVTPPTTPVVPTTPPAGALTPVVLDGPASTAPIPAPGQPARFGVTLPATGNYLVVAVADHAPLHAPLLAVVPSPGAAAVPVTLRPNWHLTGATPGSAVIFSGAGSFEFRVGNPMNRAGTAWLKVSRQPG